MNINPYYLKHNLDCDITSLVNIILDNSYIEDRILYKLPTLSEYKLKDTLKTSCSYQSIDSEIDDATSNEYNIDFDEVMIKVKNYKFDHHYNKINYMHRDNILCASYLRPISMDESYLKYEYTSFVTYDERHQEFTNNVNSMIDVQVINKFVQDVGAVDFKVSCIIEPNEQSQSFFISSMELILFTNIKSYKHL